jgi:dehydrogenase/reductase SDR family member 7B
MLLRVGWQLRRLYFRTMKFTLQQKVVIVTGATSGIGLACAEVFGRAGARIVASGRDAEKLRLLSERLAASSIDFITVEAEASDEEANRRLVEAAVNRYGGVDILIANAGISMRAMFEDLDMAVFRKVMDVNFYGSVYPVRYALPYLLERSGAVVAVSSINGHRGTPARTAYTASKYAMEGFFEALRTEVMHRGVHVLVVSPGFTGTNIRKNALRADGAVQGESPRDEGRMMTPEAVAVAIIRGLKQRKRDMVLTRQGKLVVLLNKIVPGWMDKMVYRHMAKEPDSPFK